MLTLISCPTCHHKFTIPEGAMGKRHTCPNCQSLFVAGKSVAEEGAKRGAPSMLSAAGNAPSMLSAGVKGPGGVGMDKTMLGEVDAPSIKYNCPRCKKPLESPASEAGTKKPCPSCGGRLQVPAAKPAAAAAFDPLNKTLLASDESGLQASVPAPASPLPSAAPAAPAVSAAAPPPAKKWKIYAIAAAAAVILLLGVSYVIAGRNAADLELKKFLAAQQAETERLKAEIEQKTALLLKQQEAESENRKRFTDYIEKMEARQKKLDDEREKERVAAATAAEKAEAQRRAEQRQRELDDEKKAAADARAKAEQDLKNQINDLRRQVDNANQQKTTVITQPAPVYPWYGRPHPWWGWY
jgi:hypothetical protein